MQKVPNVAAVSGQNLFTTFLECVAKINPKAKLKVFDLRKLLREKGLTLVDKISLFKHEVKILLSGLNPKIVW